MEYHELGSSGLRVSVLTMGMLAFGGCEASADVGATEEAQADRRLRPDFSFVGLHLGV